MTENTRMSENDAAIKADRILELLIQHQPGLFSHGLLHGANTARSAATALAQFRSTLIGELVTQPGQRPK